MTDAGDLERILASPTYRKAFEDPDFLHRDELRGVRLMLELYKAHWALEEHGIRSTIVVFGSARVLDPERAAARLAAAERDAAARPGDESARSEVARARRSLEHSRYYEESRELGRLVSATCQRGGFCDFVITTGGGPGLMEAANRGARDVGAKTIGFNIELPHEQAPNPYLTPELCFLFHYFATRKMHLLLRAKALVAFPGGFGTMDELFECLTLVQTGKVERLPIVLFGRGYWERAVNWRFLVEEGAIAEGDLSLFTYAETAREAWDRIVSFWGHEGGGPG